MLRGSICWCPGACPGTGTGAHLHRRVTPRCKYDGPAATNCSTTWHLNTPYVVRAGCSYRTMQERSIRTKGKQARSRKGSRTNPTTSKEKTRNSRQRISRQTAGKVPGGTQKTHHRHHSPVSLSACLFVASPGRRAHFARNPTDSSAPTQCKIRNGGSEQHRTPYTRDGLAKSSKKVVHTYES